MSIAYSFMYREARVFSVWLRCVFTILTETKASHLVLVLQPFSASHTHTGLTGGESGFVHQWSFLHQEEAV